MKLEALKKTYHQPLFKLIGQSRAVFLKNWKENEVQLCRLLSIKTGGCSEDCGYCAQSARRASGRESTPLMTKEEILPIAREAKSAGATRFCMGAAWKGVREDDARFQSVLETVREVSRLGLETCVTLGQLTNGVAQRLKEAGLTAYNHNIDTSPEHYPKIVTTHTFEDRLKTLQTVQEAGLAVCCGGILGMGERVEDRLRMLEVLGKFDPPPESVPINMLIPVPGTPLEDQPPLDVFEVVRMVAITRIALPKSKVRLSAGRSKLSKEAQALCFFAGANSIFFGDKLLTVENRAEEEDAALLRELGLKSQAPQASA